MLRPHTAIASATILDVAALADGGYAVLTRAGIEVFGPSLVRTGVVTGDYTDTVLVALTSEHFLVHGGRLSSVYEGVVGGALAKVELGDQLARSVVVTETGFFAIGSESVLVDHCGTRTFTRVDGCLDHGGVAWRGGAVVAGNHGFAILGADGAVIARADVKAAGGPVPVASGIAIAREDDVVVFDEAAHQIDRTYTSHKARLVAFRHAMLVSVVGPESLDTDITFHDPENDDWPWEMHFDQHMKAPIVIGDRFVVVSYERGARIFDRDCTELTSISTARIIDHVVSFGNGIALAIRDSPDVLWWRPDKDIVALSHDISPSLLRDAPAGLVSAEANVLYVWRTDVQGPSVAIPAPAMPMDTPIVVAGTAARIVHAGRFALRATTLTGRTIRVEHDSPWRPLTARDEAERLVDRLVGRTFDDGPLPSAAGAELAQRPLVDTIDLHGRAMFDPSLDRETAMRATWGRAALFDELAAALGTRGRILLAAVRARKRVLEPPRQLGGYDYLGTFTTSGEMRVCDHCHLRTKSKGLTLSLSIDGHDGVWHVFVRGGDGVHGDDNTELVTVHASGFEVYASDLVGQIGVDSGTAGVFDSKCPKRDDDEIAFEEGSIAGLGASVWTGHGDGFYPVYAGTVNGRVAKIRIAFSSGAHGVDRSLAKPTRLKKYAASSEFTVGDAIEHVKFGIGAVVRVAREGKIDVRFPDAMRTLVHARK